jgi:hypothetical protein
MYLLICGHKHIRSRRRLGVTRSRLWGWLGHWLGLAEGRYKTEGVVSRTRDLTMLGHADVPNSPALATVFTGAGAGSVRIHIIE